MQNYADAIPKKNLLTVLLEQNVSMTIKHIYNIN